MNFTTTRASRSWCPWTGRRGSLLALDKLAALVDLSSADVTLVHVVETPWLHAGADQEWLGYEEEKEEEIDPQAQFEREFETEGDQILENARARLPVRTGVTTLIYRGIPGEEILGEAETGDYDLVVMGASGVVDLKHKDTWQRLKQGGLECAVFGVAGAARGLKAHTETV